MQLSLAAQVAQQYFALIAAEGQEAVGRRTLASRAETLELCRKRLAMGAISEYDLRQAEAEEAAGCGQLAGLVQARERAAAALALLLGRSPQEVLTGRIEPGKPPALETLMVPAGLPSELLLRRPDLREAEQRLVAANTRIGAARAGDFPSIGLTAYLGSESVAMGGLFTGPAGIFQFAAALAQYRRAVASAFKDVRDALAAETARTEALTRALDQARLRFDAGIASRLEVLDVERNLLQSEPNRIDAERARKAALADLFKALGGGWG